MNFVAVLMREKYHPLETIECSDWGMSPDGSEISLYAGDPFESDHEEPYLRIRRPVYLAIYEYPRRDDDLAVFLTVEPNT